MTHSCSRWHGLVIAIWVNVPSVCTDIAVVVAHGSREPSVANCVFSTQVSECVRKCMFINFIPISFTYNSYFHFPWFTFFHFVNPRFSRVNKGVTECTWETAYLLHSERSIFRCSGVAEKLWTKLISHTDTVTMCVVLLDILCNIVESVKDHLNQCIKFHSLFHHISQ